MNVTKCLAGVLVVLCAAMPPAIHAADGKTRYRVRIVLDVARHRLLTDVFRQQIAREVGDGLQAALGELAEVSVTERHPWLADVQARGLARALDGRRERSEYKDLFLRIDFSGTYYEMQARHYDGPLGLAAPVVRRDRTRDRAYVARAAALLLERDLGLLGTVQSEPDGRRLVQVALQGGALGVNLGRWVRKDEVFALLQVGGDGSSQPVPWAYLQVETPPKDGICTCRLFSRYRLPRATGMRCVLLGTRSGYLRLRLMQENPEGGLTPLEAAVTLQIRRNGFDGEETTKLQFPASGARDVDTDRFGDRGRFDRLAFISVLSGDTLRARIPVALIDDGLVVLPVPPGNEESSQIMDRVRSLQRNVLEAYLVQTELFKEINALTAKPEERARALARVKQTLKRLRDDHARLSEQRGEVLVEIAKLPPRERPSLESVDQRLGMIRAGETDLINHITELEKIEKEENDPKRKEWLIQVERAKRLEKEAELGQAIAIYESAGPFATPALKKHLETLRKLWTPKDDKHAAARKFIYQVWPTLTTEGLKERLKEARQALDVCKEAGDRIGPVRLLRATEEHVQRLLKEAEKLRPNVNIDDEKPFKLIQELAPELRKLDQEIRAVIKQAE